MEQVNEVIGLIDKEMPDTFSYICQSDSGLTGRFEVEVFVGQACGDTGEGIYVHSKQQSLQFPTADTNTFFTLLKDAIESK